MNSDDVYKSCLADIHFQMSSKIAVQKEQYEQWLRKLFYVNDSLHKAYDMFYQDSFYVLLTQLLSEEGKTYLLKIVEIVNKQKRSHIKDFYNSILKSLDEIGSKLTDIEFQYLRYKRHNVCHIFQNNYEVIQDSGKIRSTQKTYSYEGEGKPSNLIDLELSFFRLLEQHGGDDGFYNYIRGITYPILDNLYKRLTSIHSDEMQIANNRNNNSDGK
jgi:hypothetical protein